MPSEVTGEVLGVTIDARDTKDVDDGFWLDRTVDRGYRVVVAIAGVGQTIRPGSMLDARARERVATRYRPWGNEPMLPFRLSEDRLALLPNRRRRAVVVEVYLRPDLELAEPPRVFLAPFRSLGKLSYGRVAETLAAAPGREEGRAGHFRPLLEEARVLALRLLERRRAAGALAIYDLSNGWVSTEEGFLKKLEDVSETIGYVIIQELMILANEMFARFAAEHGVPILYRNHTARSCAPDRRELAAMVAQGIYAPVAHLQQVLQQLAVVLEPASYAPVVRGHYGLSLPIYTHLTSPIRRYADLISQRQLAAYLRGQPLPHTAEELQAIADAINQHVAEERARDRDKFKAAAAERGRIAAADADVVAGLDGPSLEAAIKACLRSGEDAPTTLAAGIRRQLAAGTVPVMALALLLLHSAPEGPGWAGLRAAALERLGQAPEHAVSLITIAKQNFGWGGAGWTRKSAGPPHQPTFTATVEVLAPGERRLRGEATAPRSALADQRAAVVALAGYLGLPVPVFSEPAPEPPKVKAKKAHVLTREDIDSRDSIALLQEHAQGNGAALPVYEFDTRGPTHAPTVTCTCKAMGLVRRSTAGKKQDAKRQAAFAVLEALLDARRS